MNHYYRIFILLLINFIFFACSKNLFLECYSYIKLNNYVLTKDEVKLLDNYIKNLKTAKHLFCYEPEILLQCYINEERVKIISIFLNEGYLYPDHFINAFSDRMHDRESDCLQLDQNIKDFLSHYYN